MISSRTCAATEKKGYRYCADDILCAHYALKAAPNAHSLLDLGSGIGTIGLAWLAQQPRGTAKVTMLEAQDVSVSLCRRTLRMCQVQDEVELRHADLRDQDSSSLGKFDVVTANPPYLSRNAGNLPDNSQKAYCRHELRGGVAEFCAVAKDAMAPGAVFCMVLTTDASLPDVLQALQQYSFAVQRRVDVLFRGNLKSVAVVCSLERGCTRPAVDTLNVQEEDGTWSSDYISICAEMGL
ncbi:tRNA1(Val) (adenine(37)-N6)-methyltransferase [Symbiodinium microadriaticum]|uniref:tRNA1(Val) (Adenine(37)-N6)-methyltransferase n=1 Tax=Symbiodinium microadriaticum TaxID=2951 RepID=A0A1Q9D177_SYMMI|nr:tRNA1(Val) (adenine(37)-N6)-methyltransferase [Symbiodinium microadriaticum]